MANREVGKTIIEMQDIGSKRLKESLKDKNKVSSFQQFMTKVPFWKEG